MRLTALIALALAGAAAAAAPPALAAQDGSLLDKIRSSGKLPWLANDAREAGVPDETVKRTTNDFFRSGVSAGDASRFFDEEVRIVREGGSKENFGAFVRSQVDRGLRGRELAEAIHREQARRGMGKPAGAGKADERGKSHDAGKPHDDAKPNQAGKPGEAGRPNDAGKPESDTRGKPDDAGRGRKP